MDKITKYQAILTDFLERYAAETDSNNPKDEVRRRVLIDKEHNSFQLLSTGWKGSHYIFGPIFHFDIIDGKIWLQCNNTEHEVVDELTAQGVDNQDIVLGLVPPHARKFTGFAVA